MDEQPASPRVEPGSLREGVVLGLLAHVSAQTFLTFILMLVADIPVETALRLQASYLGVTQLVYMVPLLVDARIMRHRRLTARGLAVLTLAAVGANLLFVQVLSGLCS